jgi:hypothetical protein
VSSFPFALGLAPWADCHFQISNGLALADNLPAGCDFIYFTGTARLQIDNPLEVSQTVCAYRIGSNSYHSGVGTDIGEPFGHEVRIERLSRVVADCTSAGEIKIGFHPTPNPKSQI